VNERRKNISLAGQWAARLIDRGGAHLALRLGATCLLMASLLLLSSHDVFVIGTARCLQGLGLALLVPSMYSLVPRLVRPKFIGTAVGGFGAFNNIGIALGPPVGLFLLRRGPMWLFGAALITAAVTAFATAILHPVKQRTPPARLFTYRASWTALLLIVFLTTTYFGVLLAYLPINVPESNVSSVAWFFSADAVGVLAFRVPAGIFTDRYGPRWLLVSGVVATVAATVLLLAPASNVLFAVAGIGTGVGTALLLPPILVELTARSDEGSRGTAMALYSMSLAAAIATGSFGAAPLVEHFGFQTTLLLGLVLCICAGPIAFVGLRPRPLRSGY